MSDRKVLLVIDLQNDYLWEKRKSLFSFDTDTLVRNANQAIDSYKENGYDIVYIKHIYPNNAFFRKVVGFSVKGTKGAELYSGLNVVSDLHFEKNRSNSYTSESFREFMEKQQYQEIVICGIDECGCVGATARGAIATGAKVFMQESAIGCRFPEKKRQKMRETLTSMGAKYI